MFSMCLIAPRKMGIVYRMGFLAMVAGIMMIPFFSNGSFFVVPGAIIIAGYTVFDAFIWVVFCQVAQEKSEDPLKTVIFIRLIASFFSAVGAIVGVLLVGADGVSVDSSSHATTLVGYFIVIAIVLILSGEDSRWIFASAAVSYARMPRGMAEGLQEERPFDSWLEGSGLTAREKEIAGLLVQGRTQPWIAESLGISENTVGTHVRHIYQKTDVHDRQHFIDQALCNFSPESRDGENHLTEHA